MKTPEAAFGVLFVSIILICSLLLALFPWAPSSLTGWVILVVVGLPLYVLLEGLGEVVFSEKVGKSISDKAFSGARILYSVAVMLTFYGLVYLIWQVVSVYIRPYFGTLFG